MKMTQKRKKETRETRKEKVRLQLRRHKDIAKKGKHKQQIRTIKHTEERKGRKKGRANF